MEELDRGPRDSIKTVCPVDQEQRDFGNHATRSWSRHESAWRKRSFLLAGKTCAKIAPLATPHCDCAQWPVNLFSGASWDGKDWRAALSLCERAVSASKAGKISPWPRWPSVFKTNARFACTCNAPLFHSTVIQVLRCLHHGSSSKFIRMSSWI
ncbi:hypothetical protein BKA80DRAFT_265953 [Phyllosticta citrichinensis]